MTRRRSDPRNTLYAIARAMGDYRAVRDRRVGKRIARRLAGRVTGRLLGRMFR
jgi:hypothetical protein